MHPDYHAGSDLHFRLRLLKFTVMFTKRSAPAETILPRTVLQDLRHRRREQVRSSNVEITPLDFPNLTEYRTLSNNTENKKVPTIHDSIPGRRGSKKCDSVQPAISLLDTIPLFMAMSAAQIALQGGTITEAWMRLAADFMAHAVAEQYLVYESRSRETLQEAFSWGFDPECSAEEGTDEFQINAMFWEVDAVVDGWDRIRDEHVQAVSMFQICGTHKLIGVALQLIPPAGADLQVHLEMLLSSDLSTTEFERRLVNFLDKMLTGQSKPLLLQIESGKVDGLTRKDITALFEAIGIA